MGMLKDHRFWVGVLVGGLLVTFIPQLSPKRLVSKTGG
jgi:hypothetical protein